MIEQKTIADLNRQYSHIHPLLFHRSVERAKSGGDLFDIVSDLDEKLKAGVFPLIWDEESRRWIKTEDLYHSEDFLAKINKK